MKMFLLTSEEVCRFFSAQAIAVVICLLCDFLRSMRPENAKKRASDFFDTAVWFVLCGTFLILWRNSFDGEFRWYTVLSFSLTAILYYLTIHPVIFTAYCIIMKKTYSFLHTIFKFLLTVWLFLVKIIVCLSVFCKKLYVTDYEGK